MVFAGPSSWVAAALGVAAGLGSAGDSAHHSGTPVEGAGGLGARHNTDHCIGMSLDIADLDSSPAGRRLDRTRHNPADFRTDYRNHHTAAEAGAGAVGEAFAAEEALAIGGPVADRSRTVVGAAAAADSDVAAGDSRESPWLRYGDR